MSAEQVENYYNQLRKSKDKTVSVGLVESKSSAVIYEDGQTVLDVGIGHEFGVANLPRRSFLKVPFEVKEKELQSAILTQYTAVAEQGRPVDTALGRIGAKATNISKGAFTTQGYNMWPDISQLTKDEKGSSQVLIDTGTLRNSITWEVD